MKPIDSFINVGLIRLNHFGNTPLHRQIYEVLREKILTGQLKPGTRLPSTRALAEALNIARNTAKSAYEQLLAEGYLESAIGSGTHVTRTLPEALLNVRINQKQQQLTGANSQQKPASLNLSERGLATSQIPYVYETGATLPSFTRTGTAVDEFPFKLWEKLLVGSWRSLSSPQLIYQSALGYRPLREAISSYLEAARGVYCEPDQVVITNGGQHAHSTSANLLLNRDDEVWLEDPSYPAIQAVLRSTLAKIIPVRVDERGLVVEEGIEQAPHARLVYITPSHQFPSGVTMSLTRRLKLLQWAENESAWIIEDDYDSEYRYEGDPLAALQGLDRAGRVIYVGSFIKSLFPTLRVAYMVVPPSLIEPIHAARAHADQGTAVLEQMVLARFINEGHLTRHIRRMRKIYTERQHTLVTMARKHLAGLLDVQPNNTGLHLVGWLPDGVDDAYVAEQLRLHGLELQPYSSYAMTPSPRSGLVIGYGSLPSPDIMVAVKRMKPILEACVKVRR